MLTFLVSSAFDGQRTLVGALPVAFNFSGDGGLILADKLSHVYLRAAMFDTFLNGIAFILCQMCKMFFLAHDAYLPF